MTNIDNTNTKKIHFKDTPTICKKRLKSKDLVYEHYFDNPVVSVIHLFTNVRLASKVWLSLRFEYDSCMWRHQFEHQWERPKNFRIRPFQTGSRTIYFEDYSGFFMSICKRYMQPFSQNSIRRSGNWQKVKNFRIGPFKEFWFNLFFLGLLSLNVELSRRFLPFWCLSVDESCDTVKNIF